MYDVRVRMMDDTGRFVGKMIDPLKVTVTMAESAQSTIEFSLTELAAGRLDTPFVVSVVASAGGGPHTRVRGGEFIVWEDDADDSDVTGTVRYSGIEFVPWLLSMNRMHWSSSAKNGARTWLQNKQASTVGYLMAGLINEGKGRGWGANISFGFTATTDSRGAAWTAAERQSEAWPLLTSVGDILRQVTDNGLCDWYCEGTTLQLVRPGSGDVRASVILGGPQYIARPVKSSFKDVFTHLTVVPELGRNWLYLSNTGATNRFGRLEASQTQSGVKDHAVATKNAQPMLTAGRATRRQFSFDWMPDAGGPIPFEDFYIGDTVWTQTRAGKRAQRVIGVQLTREGQEPVKVRAITGDKLLGTAARAARKIGAVNVGGGVPGGTGTSVPVSPGRTFPLPAAPTAVRADSNVSQWGADGSALTSVTIAWDEVSQAEDGSEVDVALYEISARRDGTGEARAVVATTDALSWTATSWAVGVTRLVSVRAVAPNGDRSAWSTEISVTPASPARPVKVTDLQVTGQVGSWRADGTAQVDVSLAWTPVTLDTGGKVIPVSYEVASRSPERVDARTDTAAATVSGWEPGKTRLVRVRAVSGGGKGDWSDELSVPVIVPSSIVPKAPTGLTVSSNTATFQTDGSAIATVTITWTPVTQSIDNAPVTVQEYEFRVGEDTQRVTSASATFTVPSGRQASVSARALTTLNVWGDPATAIVVTGAAPAASIPAPSAPVLTAGMGGVAYRWDGLSAAAAAMPAGFGRILVDSGPSASGPWTTLGATLSAAGGGSVSGPVGTAIHLRFRSFDSLGRIGGTSVVRNATPVGVPLGELDSAVQTAINDALKGVKGLTARGTDLITNGNAVLGTQNFSAFTLEAGDQPTGTAGAFTAGTTAQQVRTLDELIPIDVSKPLLASMWVRQANPGVTSRCYFGLAPYDVDGLAISPVHYIEQAGSRTTLAAPLTAGQTTVQLTSAANWHNGATTAARYLTLWNYVDGKGKAWPPGTYSRTVLAYAQGAISGNTVTLAAPWSGATVPAGTAVGNGASGGTYMYAPGISNALVPETWTKLTATAPFVGVHPAGPTAATTAFPIATTQVKVVILANYSPSATSKQLFAGLSLSESAAVLKTADGKNKIFPSVTEPIASAAGDLWWVIDTAGTSILGVKMWNGSAWMPYLIVAEQIIATGSITGALVRANTLEVNHVSPTFGDDLNLSANESVTIIVGKQNEQADQLADVSESVGEAQSTADAASSAAGTAQATANGAASAAAGAATAAASVGQRLDRHQTYYRFGVDGLAIGDPNVPSELRLKPDRIEMTQNNVVVSYWEGGVFVADEARLDSAQIGNHLFTAYGAGRTIIRPL